MSYINVIYSGFNVSIQDMGRPQKQHLGVPVSGALDPMALRLANSLVGNPQACEALEIQILGPTLEVAAESVRVALAGTRAELEILGQDPVRFPAHQSVTLTRGQRFRVGALPDSSTAYLAVEGGFAVPRVYGSRSTYSRAGIGGLNGRVIQDGDSIPLEVPTVRSRGEIRLANDSYLDATGPFRVILGPQRDFFSDEAMALFLSRDYAVTRDADRMGMRLDGPVLEHVRGYNIVSDGIVTGAVQVPGNGLPIILLADHQTTGGYPKLGAVISADIPRLGRLRPGDALRFEEVSIEAAEAAIRDQEAGLRRQIDGMISAGAWLDEAALYRENLISGIVRYGEGESD
ncbi:MAG: biotin-dependent carboxyltransferase family protein [Alphaproteobacteria bacterium]|nr:biotin-dependent carboxyltransferase family protein [Alphaproteobacteria bacterium]